MSSFHHDLDNPTDPKFWAVSSRLPSVIVEPAPVGGELLTFQAQSNPLADLTPADPVGTVTLTPVQELPAGGTWVADFVYGDVTGDELFVFSLVPLQGGGSADFPAVVDILENDSYGTVLENPLNHAQIATSYFPDTPSSLVQPIGVPNVPGDAGSAIYAFRPQDYVRSTDGAPFPVPATFRVRVRGLPQRVDGFTSRVPTGGTFQLAFYKVLLDHRARIKVTPQEPTINEDVTFTAVPFGQDTPLTYAWNFGDLGVDSGISVTHQYTAGGLYDVQLSTGPPPLFTTQIKLRVYDDDVRTRRIFGLAKSP